MARAPFLERTKSLVRWCNFSVPPCSVHDSYLANSLVGEYTPCHVILDFSCSCTGEKERKNGSTEGASHALFLLPCTPFCEVFGSKGAIY